LNGVFFYVIIIRWFATNKPFNWRW